MVVVGGKKASVGHLNSTTIFSVDAGTWRYSADYPGRIYAADAVRYDNSFLVIGGIFDGQVTSKIYKFGADTEQWSHVVDMAEARSFAPGVIAPQGYFDCPG